MSRSEAAGLARDIYRDWAHRSQRPPVASMDAYYQFQLSTLRIMMDRVAIILDDQGVPPDIIENVLRGLTYGAPEPADAELRMAMMTDMTELRIRLADMGLRPPV